MDLEVTSISEGQWEVGVAAGESRAMKTLMIGVVLALCACSLDAADFLTQAEIDARLDVLKKSVPPWIGYIHRDRFYNTTGKFVPYAYRCPTCGRCTMYEDEIGIRCKLGVSNLVAWARESVAKRAEGSEMLLLLWIVVFPFVAPFFLLMVLRNAFPVRPVRRHPRAVLRDHRRVNGM